MEFVMVPTRLFATGLAFSFLFLMSSSRDVFSAEPVCLSVQNSVDASVPAAVATALADTTVNPGGACKTETKAKYSINDRLAVTAGELADRALSQKNCEQKTFTRRAHCTTCFNRDIAPLLKDFDGKIFHGIVAQAASIAKARKDAKCAKVPK